MGSLEDAIPLVPLHLLSCGSAFFRDKNVIYWQKGAGSYGSLLRTMCGAPGPHFLGITKFIYAQCWESYPPMQLNLQYCRSAFFRDKKMIYWKRGGESYAPLPRTICRAPGPHFFRDNTIILQKDVLGILFPIATLFVELRGPHFLG